MEIENTRDVFIHEISKILYKHKIPFNKYSLIDHINKSHGFEVWNDISVKNINNINDEKLLISYLSNWLKKKNIKLLCLIVKHVRNKGISNYITEQLFLGTDNTPTYIIKDTLIVFSYTLNHKQLFLKYHSATEYLTKPHKCKI